MPNQESPYHVFNFDYSLSALKNIEPKSLK